MNPLNSKNGIFVAIILAALVVAGIFFSNKEEAPKPIPKTAAEREKFEMDSMLEQLRQDTMGLGNIVIQYWEYDSTVDKMTSQKTYFARNVAKGRFRLDAPYDGPNEARLILRQKGNEVDVYIKVNKGQFAGSYASSNVLVRFDDAAAKKYPIAEAADGSSDIIFIENSKDFLSKLKTSKTTLIEVLFYNNGKKVLEFETKDLNWNH